MILLPVSVQPQDESKDAGMADCPNVMRVVCRNDDCQVTNL